jgi:hypothetical protein
MNPPSAVNVINTLNGGGPPLTLVTTPSQLPVGPVHSGVTLSWANAVIAIIPVMISPAIVFFIYMIFTPYFSLLRDLTPPFDGCIFSWMNLRVAFRLCYDFASLDTNLPLFETSLEKPRGARP